MSFLFIVNFIVEEDNPLLKHCANSNVGLADEPRPPSPKDTDDASNDQSEEKPSSEEETVESDTTKTDEAEPGEKTELPPDDVTLVDETESDSQSLKENSVSPNNALKDDKSEEKQSKESDTKVTETDNDNSNKEKNKPVVRFNLEKNSEAVDKTDDANSTDKKEEEEEEGISIGKFTVIKTDEAAILNNDSDEDEKPATDSAEVNTDQPEKDKDGQPSDSGVDADVDADVDAGVDTDGVTGMDDDSKANDKNAEEDVDLRSLTPLVQEKPLWKRALNVLKNESVSGVFVEKADLLQGNQRIRVSFIESDSRRCETILNRLKGIGVCRSKHSDISIFPSSVYECSQNLDDSDSNITSDVSDEELEKEESQFKKSIKSRLVVAQVVATVSSNAQFTFDYVLLIILASLIACLGLVENSSVILVASMLISPLMGPILAWTFGQVIKRDDLRNLGLRSELIGLLICLVVGFVFGLVAGGLGLHGAVWGSVDEWPTNEMRSRGMLRSLWVGVLIALPSGAGVAISVLGGNAGSLVGVAISASLLPPAVNAGMLWAYGLLAAIKPPAVIIPTVVTSAASTVTRVITTMMVNGTNTTTEMPYSGPTESVGSCFPLVHNNYQQLYSCNVSHDAALLGLVSLFLTLLNITCIFFMGVLVLKIKEVAPHTAMTTNSDEFWQNDVKVARTYYETYKGETSVSLGKQFLKEWKKTKMAEAAGKNGKLGEEVKDPVQTLSFMHLMKDVENSSYVRNVTSKLAPAGFVESPTNGLVREYNQAAQQLQQRIHEDPGIYMAEPSFHGNGQVLMDTVYNTIHHIPDRRPRPSLEGKRSRFGRARSAFIDMGLLPLREEDEVSGEARIPSPRQVQIMNPIRNPLFRKRRKGKFDVVKVPEDSEEAQALV